MSAADLLNRRTWPIYGPDGEREYDATTGTIVPARCGHCGLWARNWQLNPCRTGQHEAVT